MESITNITRFLEQAESLADSGDLDEAWESLQKAFRLEPENDRVLKSLKTHFEERTGLSPDLSSGWDESTGYPNAARNREDGTELVLVPSGDFLMGTSPNAIPGLVAQYEQYGANTQWFTPEMPQKKVHLGSFYAGKYATTASQYAEFLNRAYIPQDELNTHIFLTESTTLYLKDGQFKARPGLESFPANNVTWTGADAYCRFMDLRLPREVEWEKTARGPDGREFPWGNEEADGARARFSQRWKEKKFDVMVAVDHLPDGVGPYETYNMAGNVWEWCLDEFPHPEPGAKYKVLRGGGWNFNPLLCRCAYRSVNKHDFRNSGYGFRPFKSLD